jgi:cobalt/nickel transport system permease protein
MAHIPDGVVSPQILAMGATGTILMLSYGLKKLDIDKIPQTAMFAAVFFLSSMITFPVGPSSIHLLFNGLMGLMLGWAAVPAIFVALILQLMFFGYGGLMVLGVNTFNMALPAIIVALTLRPLLLKQLDVQTPASYRYISIIGALAGAIGITFTTLFLATSLVLSGQEYAPMMKVILATNIPLLIIEAAVTVVVVNFLIRTAPNTFRLSVNN